MNKEIENACWFCGGKLIWQEDLMPEEIGIEENGLVTNLICSKCEASWEGILIYGDE